MWHYKPDWELKVSLACPKCESINLYTRYADYRSLRLRCIKCNYNFDWDEGSPDPKVKDIVNKIRELVQEANKISKESNND